MAASFLPPILVPVVTLVFPGLVFALFFVLIEQEADDCLARRF
jgi:photosystem I reaction center subunit VIII